MVNDESSALENGVHRLVLVVEVVECNKVAQQAVEVAIDMKELINHLDAFRLLFEGTVLCHKVKQCLLPVI